MRHRRSSLPAAAVAALVGLGAALGAQAPAAAADRAYETPEWVAAAAKGFAATKAARAAAQERLGAARTTDGYEAVRIAGANRYATAVEASKALYTDEVLASTPVEVAFVANGLNYPDALAATSLVPQYGPMLLVPPTGTVPGNVMAELNRLNPDFVVIIGGTGAVSAGVESQLATVAETDRVDGEDRYETAGYAAVITDGTYEGSDPETPEPGVDTLFVVSGENFPDALAAGAATGQNRGAVVLTKRTSLPEWTAMAIEMIEPERVVILGGTGSVSDTVRSQVASLVPGKQVVRRAGADRFGTAAAVSLNEFDRPASGIMLANGLTFPDALSAAGFGAVVEYPLLLAKATCAPKATADEAAAQTALLGAGTPLEVVGVGGTGVLSGAALALTRC
ncbi:cell wall-binding repeat-containing protein [Oryzobacter sp. R7]|uniref:cell wall-binding repeat-containing protein n=1 Tax=Oryzobacter faecalis TaxID=3388656 RepID=UPI00398CE8E3